MALSWVLTVLSLLPLLEAQIPLCANLVPVPITNATLDRISGKWFYIASAFRNEEYNKSIHEIQATFFYFTPNKTEDTIFLREYQTRQNQCIYNTSYLNVQRENGTISKYEGGQEHFAHLLILRDMKTFMLAFEVNDEKNWGVSVYADKPETTEEQLGEFYEALDCLRIPRSDVVYTDQKKEKKQEEGERQHEEEKKQEEGES
ncbi:Alpha-1-acid glycoprotein 1 [Macaca mulatta]|uniref:Alpha-1-acid glycoprotein n=2 Tax=Macaca TaxID=9539 RepID=G7NG41_MACMU|nr:Alpha-1-acid glycoprotein 1 [Macaca mulatta]EHH57128.1 Alpha-1-acid glycoprotein 1 [Macaca fascicularis]